MSQKLHGSIIVTYRCPARCNMCGVWYYPTKPYGDVLACNGMDRKQPMGNLKEQSWEEIWHSPRAQEGRKTVKHCRKNCWMIGSAAPAVRHHPVKPLWWVIKNKIRLGTV